MHLVVESHLLLYGAYRELMVLAVPLMPSVCGAVLNSLLTFPASGLIASPSVTSLNSLMKPLSSILRPCTAMIVSFVM